MKAVGLNPQNYAAQFNLGKCWFGEGSYSEAEACFNAVLNCPHHKDSYEALKLLAQTKSRQQKVEEAVHLFKKVLELNPKDAETNIEIAQMYEVGEAKTALVYYESGLKIMQQEIDERAKSRSTQD